MERLRFSFRRIGVIAANTWLEAVRQRFFSLLLLLGTAVVASSLFFREFNFGTSEIKFIADFGFGALTLFGSILAIVGSAQLFFSEVDSRTVWTVLAKPVLRSEYVLGKFAGVALMIFAFVAVIGTVVGCVVWWRERGLINGLSEQPVAGTISMTGLAVFVVLQALKLLVLAASTFVIASYSRTNLFTVLTSFLVLIICHLHPLAQEVWSRSAGWTARIAGGALSLFLPNFQLFNLGDDVAAGREIPFAMAGPVFGYGLVYLAAWLVIAVFSFSRREI